MMRKWNLKIISMVLVIATLMSVVPLNALAADAQEAVAEVYVESVKMAQAKTREEAKALLEMDGYIFFDQNLNEGTGNDGIWLGYKTTTDPTKAIYDIKLMNAKGGYTLTSMKDALESQKSAFTQMAVELNYLVQEFAEAYKEGSVAAQKAYMALNFFRVVEGETEYSEENGLGYQLVNSKMTIEKLTEMLLFCDTTVFDTVIKTLTMGIQLRNGNWLAELSELGPYDSEKTYSANETELKQRAKQLLVIFQLYAQSYKAMEAVGIFKEMDQSAQGGSNQESGQITQSEVSAQQQDMATVDMARAAIYKVLFEELATYRYGTGTLRDFFLSFAEGGNEKALYPLVSILTDGEFAALSYGCVLEMISGAGAAVSDFDDYDKSFAEATKNEKPVYLYMGVNSALLNDETVVGFTEDASRDMALTGEYQFYEKESKGEDIWETGRNVALAIQGVGSVTIGLAKGALFFMSAAGSLASLTATSATGILAGIAKVCAFIGGSAFPIIITVAALAVAAYAYIRYVIDEYENSHLDWEKYPIPEYMYDVQEVGFTSTSQNDGLAAEYMKTTSYVFYEVVRSVSGKPMDLNAFSTDAAQWIAMYVSYDRPGDDAKPIKASQFKVKTGNGETPEGYTPVSRFGEVRAYNLNIWDDDSTNGLYMFYQQDKNTAVKSDRTYYISKLFLQTGESEAHCISLLEAADYIPFNLNLTPSYAEGFLGSNRVYTYLGYKLTDNAREAITDIRIEYGSSRATIQHGGITYAECGTSGIVTLYATKFEGAGSPILAGGLMCVSDRDDAPAGYEPVNFLAGGPAQSFNTASGGLGPTMTPYFLYFLPQTTFTDGTLYLGGMTYYHYDDLLAISVKLVNDKDLQAKVLAYLKEKTGRDYPCDTYDQSEIVARDYAIVSLGYPIWETDLSNCNDTVLLYPTNNPYRAIYDVKGSGLAEASDSLTLEAQGYRVWKTTHYESIDHGVGLSTFKVHYGGCGANNPVKMSANLYLSGNPSKDNIYVKGSNGEPGMMSDVQPIHMSDVICLDAKDETDAFGENSPYHIVTDYFSTNAAALTVQSEKGANQFNFYIAKEAEEKPYISSITVADALTLYRGMGGASAGLKRSKITEGMLLSQLAGQGATYFADLTTHMYGVPFVYGLFYDYRESEMNAAKFGYARTADVDEALKDVIFYFGGFSTDKAPREINRGQIQYKLLCEVPYNLTGYEGAPRAVLGIYGTTDSRAGSPITDIDFTDTPFLDGYSAVRTQNGRSVWAEIVDYVSEQASGHFMSGAKTFFNKLLEFFSFDILDGEEDLHGHGAQTNYGNSHQYFYIQIKREQEIEKPYISELYLKNQPIHFDRVLTWDVRIDAKRALLDNLFDQGAEGFVDVNLNYTTWQNYLSTAIYLGYSRTANPDNAITAIRAAHDGNALKTRTPNGVTYHLVEDLSLNDQIGGDKIYLYYTKSQDPSIGSPISDIIPTVSAEPSYYTTDTAEVLPVMRYDSWKPSDLNAGTGASTIYLSVLRPFETPDGTDPVINYGKDQTTTRKTPAGGVEGKYIAAVYVMDKNTIRQEKLAQGVASDRCTCDKITDQEVFDRLKAMGATTIIETPIHITGSEYGKDNPNKVFIGYSRTDKATSAIKRIAIQTDVLTLAEPAETKTIRGYEYDLVAEDAKRVTQLPRAINLIGTQDGQDLLAPRMYLYTSKEGKDEPIREIVIEKTPLRDGWVTVASETGINPFADLYEEAKNHAKLGSKDDSDSRDSEIVYTDELYKWMDDVADIFNPADNEVTPFYIHCKKFDGNSIEDTLPYIEKIFIAYSDSQNEAIAKLIAYEPDGFVDYDLNRNAGWPYIYIAYKRTASRANAITDLAVFTGSDPADSRRIVVGNGVDARYDLVANVDLNKGVRGSYLYLYATTNSAAGEPIKNLRVSNDVVSKKGNGITESTVMIAENSAFTQTAADLNKNVGLWSDYIYLVMERDAPAANVGALIATGSWIAIGVLAGAGIACAVVVCVKKKRKSKESDESAEA